jgi:hypothetical protein
MATKRKKRRRSSTARSTPSTKKAVLSARRGRRRRKRGLSEAFTTASAKTAGLAMVKGAAGGFAVNLLEHGIAKLMPGMVGKGTSIGVVLGASFLTHAVLKQPDIATGMAGALGYSLSRNIPGLNDDAYFADEEALYDDAVYMDEDGNPMDEDGNYLNDDDGMNDGYLNDGYLSGDYDMAYATY